MQGTIRCVVVAGMLVGCHADDTTGADAAVGPSGMIVQWSTAPGLPSSIDNGISIERARFALGSLRVVGDAGPGDPRTTASAVEMCFAWSALCANPEDIAFDDAPTGLYSQVALEFDGDSNDAYEIRGHVVVGSDELEYRIEDSSPLAFNVDIDEMVSPGETATVKLRINFAHALEAVAWDTIDVNDGRLELASGDAQMSSFRAKLAESFEIEAN